MTFAPVADLGVGAGPAEDHVFGDDAARRHAAERGRRRGLPPRPRHRRRGHFPGEGSASAGSGRSPPPSGSRCPSCAGATCGRSPRWPAAPPHPDVGRRLRRVGRRDPGHGCCPTRSRLLRGELRYRGVVMTPTSSPAPATGVGVGRPRSRRWRRAATCSTCPAGRARRTPPTAPSSRRAQGPHPACASRLSLQRVLALKRRYGLPVAIERRAARSTPARRQVAPRRKQNER